MTTKPQPPDVRSKWTQRSLEIGFLFGAAFTALLWLAAAFWYAARVCSGQEALSPAPIVFGVMASLTTIPISGFCTAVAFGVVAFFAELAVRSAGCGRDPDVQALRDVLTKANRKFAPSPGDRPPAEAVQPPEGLAESPPGPEPTPPNEDIRP